MYSGANKKTESLKNRFVDISENKITKKYLMYSVSTLIKGFLAGVILSIGGVAYLNVGSKYLGAALFSIGFFVIFSYGFSLFTDKIGYCAVQNRYQNFQLIPTWLGNLIGALVTGYILHFTRMGDKLQSRAASLCADILSDGIFSILILSVFCGVLMFIAADNYKNATNNVQKYLGFILPVMVFVLCGFEHCIVNMFYLSVANRWSLKAVGYLFVMTAGNTLGALLIPICHKAIGKIKSKKR